MRIAFTIGSLSGGGAERVVARLASKMANMGHDVYILLTASNTVSYNVDKKVNIQYIKPKTGIKGLRLISRGFSYRKKVSLLNLDVVISFTAMVNMFTLLFLLGTKQKVIISERNDPNIDPRGYCNRLFRNFLYEFADGIVFQTTDAMHYFHQTIQDKSTIIINPIDNAIPAPFVGDRIKQIVTVGRLEPQKNHKLLIDAFAEIADKIPEYKLFIYGKGSIEQTLQTQIMSLKLEDRVFLMGYHDDVLEKIIAASLFVLPSDYEGISNSLLEAMSIGLPVISTDHPIGGARLLIRSGVNGVLVEVNNKEELKVAIINILSNHSLAVKISKEATKVKDLASVDNVALKWIKFIESIISK